MSSTTTDHALRPTEGARFLLERQRDDGARATYRATIYVPDADFTTTAVLVDDGTVELVAPTGASPALDAALAMFAKLTARGAAKRRDDGMPVWPARILRWRPDRGTSGTV